MLFEHGEFGDTHAVLGVSMEFYATNETVSEDLIEKTKK